MAWIQRLFDAWPRECPHRHAELIAQFFGFWPISVKNNINQQFKLEKENTGITGWKLRREIAKCREQEEEDVLYFISVNMDIQELRPTFLH